MQNSKKPQLIQLFLILSMLFFISISALAQVVQIMPIKILDGINNGSITMTLDTIIVATEAQKMIDGNPYVATAIQNRGSLTVTLHFNEPVKISKNKIFAWINGSYDLESADSQSDLDSRSGSYKLLVDDRGFTTFTWDSLSFNPWLVSYVRLILTNPANNSVIIGEWQLSSEIILNGLVTVPESIRMVPNTHLQLGVKMIDSDSVAYPYNLVDAIYWTSLNSAIATVDELGMLSALQVGTTTIKVEAGVLKGQSPLEVLQDFTSPNAQTLRLKVALLLQDPKIPQFGNKRIHQKWGWGDPMAYAEQLVDEFKMCSGGVIQYEIKEIYDDTMIFTKLDNQYMSLDTIAYYYSSSSTLYGVNTEGTLQNLAEKQGRVKFDYNGMVDYHDLDTKRNQGEIDEVWVYAHPFGGMYESQLMGPGAFWYNSPPLAHAGLEKLLPVMGWNYERGIAEAMESYGHRSESALWHLFGRWDNDNPNPNPWEIYTRYDKIMPGKAHVGNIHYPPNGQSDYDFGNTKKVITYADNWKRYPTMLDQTREVNRDEWGKNVSGNYHLGYMRWWYSHLPHFDGVTDGTLNNWWHYIVDYEAAVAKAEDLTGIEIRTKYKNLLPGAYSLEQNYPNPFNPITKIAFVIAKTESVSLKVFNLLGQEVAVIFEGVKPAGKHEFYFNAHQLASGLYFYQLRADKFVQTKKFILIR